MRREGAIAAGLAAVLLSGTALAETITLNPGDNVQAAINRARPGDTIALNPGTYNQSLNFSGKHGAAGAPITLKSAQGNGSAKIVAQGNQAVLTGNRLSHINVDGLHLVSTSRGGDTGGIKFWGSYEKLHDVKITNNLVTGQGQDGIKVFNMAPNNGRVLVAGNTIDGNWRQEGIDNVSVVDVTYEGNTIKGKAGFAGITWKAGSTGVKLVNNTIDIDADTAVSVGGYGNSRLGRSYPGEFKDNEAEGSVVTGNAIRGDVRVISAENNRITGNNISGRISNGKNVHMPGSITSRNNTISNNGAAVEGAEEWDGDTGTSGDDGDDEIGGGVPVAGGGGYFLGGSGRTPSQFDRNVDGLTQNLYDTDESFWYAVENGEASALRRLNDLVSGGLIVREGNNIINRATGQVVSTVGRTIGDAVDTVMNPVEDYVSGAVETLKCNVGGALIGGAATVINGIFTGGRSTFAGQVTEHMLTTAGNLCMSKQLAVQQRQLNEMKKMTASLNQNVVGSAGSISGTVGQSVRLYGPEQVGETYQSGASARMTADESAAYQQQLRAQTDQARRNALETAAMGAAAEREYARMADEALELTQSAEGQTAALQGLAQLERAKEGAASARDSARVAFDHADMLAEEERRAGERLAQERRDRLWRGLGDEGTGKRAGFQLFQ